MSGDCLSSLQDMQSVIEVRITNLNGLRKLPSSELTQYEIRNVEGRLIQLFGRQLASKHGIDTGSESSELKRYPNFKQWLHVVDVHHAAAECLMEKVGNLSQLIKLGDSEIRTIMKICGCEEKEITRLIDAVKTLKKVFRANYPPKDRSLEDGAKSPDAVSMGNSTEAVADLSRYRSSSPSVSSSPEQKRPSIDSLDSDLSEVPSVPITPPPFNNQIFQLPAMATPPHTPPFTKRVKGKGTPPPSKRQYTSNLPLPGQSNWNSVDHLNTRTGHGFDSATLGRAQGRHRDHRRHSDDHNALRLPSPSRSEETLPDIGLPPKQPVKLVPPKSPQPQRSSMMHAIKHRWSLRPHRFNKKTSMRPQSCDYCHEKIVVLQRYKCKDCKYVCHSNCKFHAEKVPSCGLPRKYEEIFKNTIERDRTSSPIMRHRADYTSSPIMRHKAEPSPQVNLTSSTGESSSNPSSTTSSTPSSPAPFISTSGIPPPSPANPSPSPLMTIPQFKFPPDVNDDFLDNNENVTSTSSDRTITVDSHETHDPFTDSERTLPEEIQPVDEITDPEPNPVATRKNSQKHASEWDIPFEQLTILDLIGTGRFGAVHKGKWHGDVAVKMMDIDTDDEKQLQAFKREVSYFRKTRHDFVVLFMGACMRPPRLAIVTSLCKGQTLYTHIHLRKDRFNINRTIQIATQITQGMGYLHHRGIVHKDLKSKNIFIENGKVVITDFALFSIGRLSKQKARKDSLVIPDGWLCYLAPELITSLKINTDGTQDMELPFSEKSDVYSFGTIWYELLAGEWPFHKQPVETVIWQVGKGLKQPLNHLQASRDVKEILMMCWSYSPDSRPIFQHIKKTILRLPKKKGLHRSPSHPLHLSRSAESVL